MTSPDFNPYAAPQADLESRPDEVNAWRQRRLLVYREGTPLPGRCYQCNRPAEQRLSRKLYWTPAWPWLLFLLAPLAGFLAPYSEVFAMIAPLSWPVALILAISQRCHFFKKWHLLHRLVLRQRTELVYAICDRHRRIDLGLQGAAVLFLAANMGCSYLAATSGSSAAAEGVLVLGLAALGIAILLAALKSALFGLRARRIRDGKVWLGGCGRPFLDSLPEFPDTP